jgi:transcriptional regulator with XRE-family HTH domain
MKYKKVIVCEDKEILKGRTLEKIATLVGCDMSYISRLRSGQRIAPESFYLKLKHVLDNSGK